MNLRVSLDYLSLCNAVGFAQVVQIEKLRHNVVTTDAAEEDDAYEPRNESSQFRRHVAISVSVGGLFHSESILSL